MAQDLPRPRTLSSAGSLWAESWVRDQIKACTWFCFDLDDTLYDYSETNFWASRAVIDRINRDYDIPMGSLQQSVMKIVASGTNVSPVSRTSWGDLQMKQFETLMKEYGKDVTREYIQKLVTIYRTEFESACKLKENVFDLFLFLRAYRKKIAILTEGPKDRVEWTLDKLGLLPDVSAIVTDDMVGKSKENGFFDKIYESFMNPKDRSPGNMVYLGDDIDKDIKPLQKQGILAMHFNDEAKEPSFQYDQATGRNKVVLNSFYNYTRLMIDGSGGFTELVGSFQ